MAELVQEKEADISTPYMKAAHVVEFNAPLSIRTDVPIPTCPPDLLLIKLTASSLCMSDIAAWQGHFPSVLPFCGGHEPVGVVHELGSAVRGFAKGDRVGFSSAMRPCGDCRACVGGEHRFCRKKTNVGYFGPCGGFSEYCLSDPNSTAHIPDGISDEVAAPLLCAGLTAYGALKKIAKRQTGGTAINIVGSGGVGHMAIMYAKAMGFTVHAFDINEEKLQLARSSGADKVFNSLTLTPDETIQCASTLVVSAAPAAYDLAFRLTGRHGTIVGVGIPANRKIEIDVFNMVLNDHCFLSSNVGSKLELVEALDIADRHKLVPVYETRHIDQLNEGYEEMAAGKIAGRLVYKFD